MPQPAGHAANRAYGDAAGWARRLALTTPIVASDLAGAPYALFEAARRRKRGEPFSAGVFMEDRRARCAMFLASPPVFAQVSDYDDRARLLDAVAAGQLLVGGRKQAELEADDPRYLRSAVELLVSADVVVTRSSVEREALCTRLGRRFLYSAEIAPFDPAVPLPPQRRDEARSIVVWAPHYPAEACGILAYALEEFAWPAVIVCAGGAAPPMRAGTRFVGVADAAAALADAGVVIDASLADPGSARALARLGVPLAVAACSGAADWLDGVATYDPWNHLSIASAVANVLGAHAPRERRPGFDCAAEHARALAQAVPRPLADGPLVSVVVPTLNQRSSLYEALASIAAQTYPHVELVLVNDGGPPLDRAALTGWGRLQIVELPEQRGVASALNAGIAAATGKYIANLADDDLFCPDHIAQLVEPLERLGGDVAHSIELRDNFTRNEDGSYTLTGHALMVGEPARKTALQVANLIGGPSMMVSRAAYAAVGTFDDRAGFVSDLEMWMQLSEKFDFIHVDRVTAIMSCRNDPAQISSVSGAQAAACLRYVYALHPTKRASVAQARENFIRYNERSGT